MAGVPIRHLVNDKIYSSTQYKNMDDRAINKGEHFIIFTKPPFNENAENKQENNEETCNFKWWSSLLKRLKMEKGHKKERGSCSHTKNLGALLSKEEPK